MKMKLTLRQGFILIDETCTRQSTALAGLESFAGAQVGTNQKLHEIIYQISSQISTSEDDLMRLQKTAQSGDQKDPQTRVFQFQPNEYNVAGVVHLLLLIKWMLLFFYRWHIFILPINQSL